jgi:hypothetical protein
MSARWKLVPVEPTQEVVAEVNGDTLNSYDGRRIAGDYMDMLTAAPPAPDDAELVEGLARDMAARHYAERFKANINSEAVQMNARGNWQCYANEARAILAYLAGAQ